METLQQQIKNQIKEAMMAKDTVKLTVLRGLSSAITNDLVDKGRTPQGELTDEETLAVIRRAVKQRKDSIEQFTAGGREDLAADEKAELAYLEVYLPQMMSFDDVKKTVEAKKTELGIEDAKDKGKLMAEIMKDLKGKAEGMDVKNAVDSLF
ncbi:GatB/YqeY domain-containing protein [Candidatus Parcubacteria bacterium]|nr:GatB/YqeY domain-containing protein [Candidatus Parcubacteria bacterium]